MNSLIAKNNPEHIRLCNKCCNINKQQGTVVAEFVVIVFSFFSAFSSNTASIFNVI